MVADSIERQFAQATRPRLTHWWCSPTCRYKIGVKAQNHLIQRVFDTTNCPRKIKITACHLDPGAALRMPSRCSTGTGTHPSRRPSDPDRERPRGGHRRRPSSPQARQRPSRASRRPAAGFFGHVQKTHCVESQRAARLSSGSVRRTALAIYLAGTGRLTLENLRLSCIPTQGRQTSPSRYRCGESRLNDATLIKESDRPVFPAWASTCRSYCRSRLVAFR